MAIRSGALLYGVPTRNNAPIPGSTWNKNFSRVGADGSRLKCDRK